jgi:hypothetical protein
MLRKPQYVVQFALGILSIATNVRPAHFFQEKIIMETGLNAHAAVGDTWFRFEDVRYAAPLNEYDEPQGPGRLAVELRRYTVTKVTPKGVWLFGSRFVLADATKKFACPTQEAARQSFLARKRRQLRILNAQVADVQSAIELGEAKVPA